MKSEVALFIAFMLHITGGVCFFVVLTMDSYLYYGEGRNAVVLVGILACLLGIAFLGSLVSANLIKTPVKTKRTQRYW